LEETGAISVEVFGIDGKMMHQEIVSNHLKNNKIGCYFEKGVYIVVVRTAERVFRGKVVVW